MQGVIGIFSGDTSNFYRIDVNGNKWTENEIGLGEIFPMCK